LVIDYLGGVRGKAGQLGGRRVEVGAVGGQRPRYCCIDFLGGWVGGYSANKKVGRTTLKGGSLLGFLGWVPQLFAQSGGRVNIQQVLKTKKERRRENTLHGGGVACKRLKKTTEGGLKALFSKWEDPNIIGTIGESPE